MTRDREKANNRLAKNSSGKIEKSTNNPAIQIILSTLQLGESVRTAYSYEVTKSSAIKTEYEIWEEYDRNQS